MQGICRGSLMRTVLAGLLCLATMRASGQTLTMGVASSIVSLDPHYYNAAADKVAAIHIFDRLIDFGPDTRLQPGLATAWRAVEPTIWEFTLRPDVHWHDGVPFTADDVAFTIGRVPNVPNSPGGYAGFVQAIRAVEVMEPLVIRFHTATPYANLPLDLASVSIVSRHIGEGATTADYNSGKAAIGTGPYRFAGYVAGDRLQLDRNDVWWGARPEWQRVVLRTLTVPGARTAALLAGDVDVIDSVPIPDLDRFRGEARFAVFNTPTQRTFDLRLNMRLADPPYITDNAGKPLVRNPLADPRVRQALTLSINREALSARVMDGACTPTIQWLPKGSFSYAPNLVPLYDPAKARALLIEAGYPEGFRITLHGPSDRYPNGPAMAQAVAQMWTRSGINTQVEVLPWASFSQRLARSEFAISMGGLGVPTGEARYVLLNFVGTRDPGQGRGASNHSSYSNPALDRIVDQAAEMFDQTERERLLISATEMAIRDNASITICQIQTNWAARKDLLVDIRVDERTLAMGVQSRR